MIRRFTGVLTIIGGALLGATTGNAVAALVCVVGGVLLYASAGRAQ